MTIHPVLCISLILLFVGTHQAQEEMDWMENWTNFNPNQTEYPTVQKKMFNTITEDSFLPNDAVYLMSGDVYITNGATLTIQEGTIIRCDPSVPTSLIVTRGASIIAKGTAEQPIIFTSNNRLKSRKSGDWGGIIIAGSGNVFNSTSSGTIEGDFEKKYSVYGGNTPLENTINLSYVRIEFAGKKIHTNNECNGLTLYAQDNSAEIDHIMISYSGDDSFEFFGGSTNASHLISYKAKDDDYDINLGYNGTLKSILAIRHPLISDISGSYALEVDGNPITTIPPTDYPQAVITDASIISLSDNTNYIYTSAAIACNHNAGIKITDSRISGFANIVKFDDSYHSYQDLKKSFILENSICNIHSSRVTARIAFDGVNSGQSLLKYNMFTKGFRDVNEFLENPLNKEQPKFTLKKPKTSYTVN